MSIGPPIEVDGEELQRISKFIQENFNESGEIESIHRLEEGANAEYHVVAKSEGGKKYGMKVCARGIPHGTDKEKIVADLAEILKAPNWCKVEQYEGLKEIENLKDKKVNIVKWLSNSSCLRSVPPKHVKKSSEDFFYQYGEWSFFAMAFGIRDRHLGNWVWYSEDGKLSMIDNQDAFNTDMKPVHLRIASVLNKFSNIDFFRDKREDFDDFKNFVEGLKRMNQKIKDRKNRINDLLDAWSFTSNYESRYIEDEFSDLLPQIISSF